MAGPVKKPPAPAGKKPARRAPQPIQVAMIPGGFLLKIGKGILRGASGTPMLVCTFFNTLDGSGWTEPTIKLWESTMVPLLVAAGVDVAGPVMSVAELYAKYGKYLRATLLVVKTVCGVIGFDLTPTSAEKRDLDALKKPAPSPAPGGGGGGGGGGGLLLLGGLAAALLLLKKRR